MITQRLKKKNGKEQLKNFLQGLKPVYVINLESRKDRLESVLESFERYGIEDYTVIKAYTPKEAIDIANIENTKDIPPEGYTTVNGNRLDFTAVPAEIACTLSHLKAMDYFLKNSDADHAIIMEDDISFDPAKYWGFTWQEFMNSIDFEYNMLQLAILNFEGDLNNELHLRTSQGDSTTTIYLITRKHAQYLVDTYYPDKLPPKCIADLFLYNGEKVYAINLFTTNLNVSADSDITPDDSWGHYKMRSVTMQYWKNKNPHIV
jgi:GR25 family glycosyltransferase involved in LPS biosynthesis